MLKGCEHVKLRKVFGSIKEVLRERTALVLDDCWKIFRLLEKLEVLIQRVEELKSEYEERVMKNIERQSVITGSLIALVLIILILPSREEFFSDLVPGAGSFDIFFKMFAITFIALIIGYGAQLISHWCWKHDYLPLGQKHIAHLLRKGYLRKQTDIFLKIKVYLNDEILETTELPQIYLNTRSLSYIIGCLEAKEANTLAEATHLLVLESKDIQVHDVVVTEEDTITKAQRLIKNPLIL